MRIVEADITTLSLDAIVNAANESLLGGGGVDGAIHRTAGHALLEACRALPEERPGVRCPTGEARITPGFDLPARFVIHTVGPVWQGGRANEAGVLASCYRNAFHLAADNGIASIAFPAISCGVYGFPVDLAITVAIAETCKWRAAARQPNEIVFCCFDAAMARAYRAALAQRGASP
ncbi:MAG: O-acetyl-ADP-ribose deacetylase [Rhodanobacteraceae bacterium]